jgi:hypothetical protein
MSPIPAATAQVTYEDLYARWERGAWSATEIDLERDRYDWRERMSPEQRDAAAWMFTLFLHGENAVAVDLAPFITAAPLEAQQYFLATQQADEARHAVFFSRFLSEVVGTPGDSVTDVLAATEPELSWGHRQVFGRLERLSRELPGSAVSTETFAGAVTLYHLLIEAALAEPAQVVLAAALERLDVLPGFREGIDRISHDEHRHIAFGVRILADMLAEQREEATRAITAMYREVIPWLNAVAMPPAGDPSYTESLGFTLEDLFATSAQSQEGRFRATGLAEDHINRFMFPLDVTPRERAQQGLVLLRAGVIGPPEEPVVPDPEAVSIVFDLMRRSARPDGLPDGTVIQWEFADAGPWTIRFEGGEAVAEQGSSPRPDLTLRTTFPDWIALGSGEANPLALLARRRLRLRGSRRLFLRMGTLFG